MKKMLLLSVVAIAGSALATDVVSDNSYGVLPVTSSAKETMVAVPFVGESAAISIDQMVKAQGLSAGDKIYALPQGDGKSYQVWELNAGKTAWVPVVGVEVGSGATAFTPPAASATTIARGQAFWLVRSSSSTVTFYVMGVGESAAAAATTISQGWNLVGQSSANGGKTLDDIKTAVGAKGSVRLNNGTRYTYAASGKWYRVSGNTPTEVPSSTVLPTGEGFWIVRQASGNESVAL